MLDKETKEAILEAQAKASLGGHDLGPFEKLHEPVGGYESVCRLCDHSIWVAGGKILYVGLAETCPKEPPKWVEPFKMRELADPDDWERLRQKIKAFDEKEGTILYKLVGFDYNNDEEE